MYDQLPTVRTPATRCDACDARLSTSTHDDPSCGGLVIDVDGSLQCAECGVGIAGSTQCPECGASVGTGTTRHTVSLRPEIAEPELETALARRLRGRVPDPCSVDRSLSATAGAHARDRVEATHHPGRQPESLRDRIVAQPSPVGSYQTYSFEAHPSGQTAEAVATELLQAHLAEFPDPETEFTHLGVGARWDPRGTVVVGVVAVKRLVDVPNEVDPARIESAIHEATNRRRRDHGHDELGHDPHLAAIARSHSRAMAAGDYVQHRAPDGTTTMDRYREHGYESRRAAENISKRHPARGTDAADIAADVVTGWMNSKGHRENILTGSLTAEGIGVYQASDGALLATQNFS